MDQWRTDGKKTTWFWVDDDGDKVANATDHPHDLSYSTTSVYFTAADGNFPLGDLNWFPDKKAEWKAWTTSVEFAGSDLTPLDFELSQNYPNPLYPTTKIAYRITKAGHVKLTVYNMLGQKVATLVDAKQTAGTYRVKWAGSDEMNTPVPSGIYFYKLEVGSQSITRKMLLVR